MRLAWILGICLASLGCSHAVVPAVPGTAGSAVSRAAQTTPAAAPVLLVHGHNGSSSNFAAITPWLKDEGFDPVAIDFVTDEWKDWDLDALSDQVAMHVLAMRQRTGRDKVDIVAHSLGGIVARHYIKFKGGDRYINHLVCLGSPHHGVGYAAFGPGIRIATLFRPHSRQLNQLNRPDETHGTVSYTNVWSTADYMELLPLGSGRLVGAFNYRINDVSHGGMVSDKRIFPAMKAGLLRPLDAVPGPESKID